MAQEDESGWVAPSDDPGDGEAPDGGGDSPVDAPKEPPLPPLRNEPLDLPPAEPYAEHEDPLVQALEDQGVRMSAFDEETPPEPPQPRSVEEILALPHETPLTPWEEKAVREHFGYAHSETRTRAERARVAGKITAKLTKDDYQGELPPDIAEIWTGSDEATARHLIGAWGLARFRNSALHRVALTERERDARMAPIQKEFIEAQKKAAKK